MTEREQKPRGPTNKDIQRAIEGLAQAYHEFVQALQAREESDRHERRYIRDRLDQLFGAVDGVQKKVDRQLDQVWKEVDALRERIDRLEGGPSS